VAPPSVPLFERTPEDATGQMTEGVVDLPHSYGEGAGYVVAAYPT
jgi:hypothetical protein